MFLAFFDIRSETQRLCPQVHKASSELIAIPAVDSIHLLGTSVVLSRRDDTRLDTPRLAATKLPPTRMAQQMVRSDCASSERG